ncbi:PEP-CTERM sorting domain-containing protein [Pontiellaceae bacterium B12227]|nr:PEP-CTERM sorting domain-containing protein [Pontiellaceae bacterium B12227]
MKRSLTIAAVLSLATASQAALVIDFGSNANRLNLGNGASLTVTTNINTATADFVSFTDGETAADYGTISIKVEGLDKDGTPQEIQTGTTNFRAKSKLTNDPEVYRVSILTSSYKVSGMTVDGQDVANGYAVIDLVSGANTNTWSAEGVGVTTVDVSAWDATTFDFIVNDLNDAGDAESATAKAGYLRSISVSAIPEPATLGLVTAFGAGVLFIRRRFMM